MSKPQYCLEIEGIQVSCEGEQLRDILYKLDVLLEDLQLTWYAANVFPNITPKKFPKWGEFSLCKIGTTQELRRWCVLVSQFDAGVFLAYPKGSFPVEGIEIGTEDEKFRDMNNAYLEIRAFDVTCYEIFTNDYDLLTLLKCYYGGELSENPSLK